MNNQQRNRALFKCKGREEEAKHVLAFFRGLP
jgi:hypothetical protein